jgi:hypothetical protein
MRVEGKREKIEDGKREGKRRSGGFLLGEVTVPGQVERTMRGMRLWERKKLGERLW